MHTVYIYIPMIQNSILTHFNGGTSQTSSQTHMVLQNIRRASEFGTQLV